MSNLILGIILGAAGIWIAGAILHFPIAGAGTILFIPLLFCLIMMLAMHHGGGAGKRTNHH